MPIEHEIKLTFPDAASAREVIHAAGGRLTTARRLLDDQLFDHADGRLRRTGQALRVRREGRAPGAVITWKGPVQPGRVKSREEIETRAADADAVTRIITAIGFAAVFRTQKYREEYALEGATVTVDETPMGVFVEIEGAPEAVPHVAARLGRGPDTFNLDSYATLWRRWCEAHGRPPHDMIFGDAPA